MENVREIYTQIVKQLIARQLSISVMESATGGQIASLLTDTEGASAVFKGSFVTYSNEAKIAQGVPAEVIAAHGVYSLETARAMAEACKARMGADIAIGVTGSFGNVDPANADSVPGEVYYCILGGKTILKRVSLSPQPDRISYKLLTAGIIAADLMQILSEHAGAL